MSPMDTGGKKAVAILYDADRSRAPKVLASGQGRVAEQILEMARLSSVHVMEDPDLVEVLAQIPVDDEIPPELYRTVAEILNFVYRLNGKYKDRLRRNPL